MKKILTFSTLLLKRALITLSILLFIFFLTISAKFYKTANSKKNLHRSVSKSSWKDLAITSSAVTPLGSPGVTYFKNLFLYKNHYLVALDNDKESFDPHNIFSEHGSYHYNIEITNPEFLQSKKNSLKRSKMIPGTTLILSASDEMKSMQAHYFHFCEEFLLGWSAYRHLGCPPIETIVYPDIDNWKGRFHDISAKIITSVLPNVQVISASEFKSLSKKYLLQFENAIIVDRHTCHKNDEVNKFNKMVLAHKNYIKKEYVREIRDSVLETLRTYDTPNTKPYITYIMRKSYRYLEPEFEKKLLSQIQEQFPQYRLNPVWLENYTFSEQMQIIRNTKVLIGAHGNGLTHQLFLPSNSLVIEIFPEDAYANDYQLLSQLSGHTYFGLDPKNGIISKGEAQMPIRGNVNQVITEFDLNIITKIIQDFTSRETDNLPCEKLNETSLSE